MNLTSRQLRQLRANRGFLENPPTIARLVSASWKSHLVLLLAGGLGFAFTWWAAGPGASLLIAGLVAGALLRDLGWYRRLVRSWPLNREITDWQRVDALLAEADRNQPSGS